MSELVINSPRRMCCGLPRTECRCGRTPNPLEGYDPNFAPNPENRPMEPTLTANERKETLPVVNLLDFDDRGRLRVTEPDEADADETRNENRRRLGLLDQRETDRVLFGDNFAE